MPRIVPGSLSGLGFPSPIFRAGLRARSAVCLNVVPVNILTSNVINCVSVSDAISHDSEPSTGLHGG